MTSTETLKTRFLTLGEAMHREPCKTSECLGILEPQGNGWGKCRECGGCYRLTCSEQRSNT